MTAVVSAQLSPALASISTLIIDQDLSSSSDSGPSSSPESSSGIDSCPREPMREFVWGDDVVRKALPSHRIPTYLDPDYVDVDDPRELPLCWYGVPFDSDCVFKYAERIGIARRCRIDGEVTSLKVGDLNPFKTYANFDDWFKKKTGLQIHLAQVWGHPDSILTFFSNHKLRRITEEKWGQVCDILDDMDYPEEYQLEWYLDESLNY